MSRRGQLIFENANVYIDLVKKRLKDEEKIKDFLRALNFYKQSGDAEVLIKKVKEILKYNAHLLEEFSAFLPEGYKIRLIRKTPKFAEEVCPIVKDQFGEDSQVYKSFLDILNLYKEGKKDLFDAYYEMVRLTKNQGDIRTELKDSVIASTEYERDFAFIDKVKMELRKNPEDFTQFWNFLHLYGHDIISGEQFDSLVVDFIRRYPRIKEGFKRFSKRCEDEEEFLLDVMKRKCALDEEEGDKPIKIKQDWSKIMKVEDWNGTRNLCTYFKIKDMESLSANVLQAEIKEICEKEKKMTSMLLLTWNLSILIQIFMKICISSYHIIVKKIVQKNKGRLR